MIYLWTSPVDFQNHDIGVYDRSCSPDRFLLKAGRVLQPHEVHPVPTVEFEIRKNRVLQFDCLPNNTLVPLVNNRIKTLLEALAPNDIQFFSAKLVCSDGELNGYQFLNVIHTFEGIDHEKSSYSKMKLADAISRFKYLTYKPNCMEQHQLARDREYLVHLLVNEKIKTEFDKEQITGVNLVRPEDFYAPITYV